MLGEDYRYVVFMVAQYFEIPLWRVWALPYREFELLAAAMWEEVLANR